MFNKAHTLFTKSNAVRRRNNTYRTHNPIQNASSRVKSVRLVTKLDFNDVLIVPKKTTLTSRKDVSLTREIKFENDVVWKGVPIISSNMDTVSDLNTFNILKDHNYITCFPKSFNKHWLYFSEVPIELIHSNNYMLSSGVSKDDLNILISLIHRLNDKNIVVKFVCLDVANGYMPSLGEASLELRKRFPNMVIVAGNVVTPEATCNLIANYDVNIVKIGIGSGSVCTTRLKTGVGYPQLSAILECGHAARNAGGYIISDGGIVNPCDISKALGAGADFVMCGSIFACHEESPGTTFEDSLTQTKFKRFYGMSSEIANNKYNNGLQNYRTAEGKEVACKIKGSLHDTIKDINGSLRSTCTYTNSSTIGDLYKNTKFVQVLHHHNTLYG